MPSTSTGAAPLPRTGCPGCREGEDLDIAIAMAFQPIIRLDDQPGIFAYEALVRGPNGEGAAGILAQVTSSNRYAFDQACRVKAIETAAGLGLGGGEALLSINFLPNAVYRPEACIRTSLAAAGRVGLPADRLMFEVTEGERVEDPGHLVEVLSAYRRMGFKTAIDDFGAGYAGMSLLADFQPDYLKIDIALVRGVDADRPRRAIVDHLVRLCTDLGVTPIAEGVERAEEMRALRDLGIGLFQGYLFARPGFRSLPEPHWPAVSA
jgi:EAL domain-containing protein (putative c-di-GMP-specific phosphodiesterase class I)